jgi:triacylglycerol lipase
MLFEFNFIQPVSSIENKEEQEYIKMLVRKINTISWVVFTFIVSVSFVGVPIASAQDNSDGRYRPDGRQIARQVAGMFGERLYEVRTYDPEPQVEEFAAAEIFYPLTLGFAPPIGAIAFTPGYGSQGDAYAWWGPMLASFGYAVMIIDTNDPTDTLEARKNALIAAVDFLRAENTQSDSPIAGRIDTDKIAIMGHSIGGGASLAAADQLGDSIKAVIPLSPYCCELGQSFSGDYSGQDVPTLIFASAEDTVAPPADHARALYDSISDSTARAYLEFATGDHVISTNGGTDLPTLGRYSLAWYKLHLDGETRYADAIYGDQDEEYAAKFTNFDSAQ